MTDDEIAISQSTPRYRFDVKPAPVPAPARPEAAASIALDPKAEAFVTAATSDPQQPVVMFALEWCEFCWSVRKLFKAFDVPYRSVDLDSADDAIEFALELAAVNPGGGYEIRPVIYFAPNDELAGAATMPNVVAP